MSIRSEIRPYEVIDAGSMAASLTSTPTIVQKISMVGYQFIWSAGSSPVGTIGVQVSNDYALDPTGTVSNSGTWSTYYFLNSSGSVVTSLNVSGASGSAVIELPNISFYAVRAIYTRSSGTGTLDVIINGKVS